MASTTKPKGPSPEPARPFEPKSKASASKAAAPPETARPTAMRETIESIVVAFILAFMFKTFEAEAFVIPTGSMAPTLYGRNKAATCPKCGTEFTIGASDEVETETDYVIPGARIDSAICPNCRYRLDHKDIYDVPVFKGDGILVNKFSFEIRDPQRWQVVVFKYPEEPKTNYIKRCVALPNETICIRQGNLYRKNDQDAWEILRKDDPNKQRVLQMNVYDNDHPERDLLNAGWPERWAAVKRGDGANAIAGWAADVQGWVPDGQTRTFHLPLDRGAKELQWFRYRNYVPTEETWRRAGQGQPLETPQARLITDFCGYNAFSSGRIAADDLGFYWVGDLTLNCRIDVQQAQPDSQVVLELNEGARVYRCRIDLASGRAALVYAEPRDKKDPGQEHKLAEADTRFVGTGQHDVSFANVDDRLCLWVDNRLIDFGQGACYSPYGGSDIQRPWDEDSDSRRSRRERGRSHRVPPGVAAGRLLPQRLRPPAKRPLHRRVVLRKHRGIRRRQEPARRRADPTVRLVPHLRERPGFPPSRSGRTVRNHLLRFHVGAGRVLYDGGQQPPQQRQPALVEHPARGA